MRTQVFLLNDKKARGNTVKMCRKCEKDGINSYLVGILVRKVGIMVQKVGIHKSRNKNYKKGNLEVRISIILGGNSI
jgi:hypothetical protein